MRARVRYRLTVHQYRSEFIAIDQRRNTGPKCQETLACISITEEVYTTWPKGVIRQVFVYQQSHNSRRWVVTRLVVVGKCKLLRIRPTFSQEYCSSGQRAASLKMYIFIVVDWAMSVTTSRATIGRNWDFVAIFRHNS